MLWKIEVRGGGEFGDLGEKAEGRPAKKPPNCTEGKQANSDGSREMDLGVFELLLLRREGISGASSDV